MSCGKASLRALSINNCFHSLGKRQRTGQDITARYSKKHTDLIKHARLDFTDALFQIKARLLQCTLGAFRDGTRRGLVTLRKCALTVLYFEVHND